MMKRIFAAALLTSFFGVSASNCYANDNTSFLNEHKFEAYASYFGFKNVSDYLKFSAEMNRLMAGDKNLGSPIFQTSAYEEAIASGKSYAQLQPEQKAAIASLVQQRRSTLALTLGVAEDDLDEIMSKYIAFSELNASLSGLNKNVIFSASESSAPIERITVTGKKLDDWGGYGSLMMGLRIADAAQALAIGQYYEFTVYFESRDTEQKFRYNNYSGAWSTSSEKVCMSDNCQTAPVIE